MSLFNQTIGVKFFVDGEDYVEGQHYGKKITHTFELLKLSNKLKQLFKRDKVAIGDVFYDKDTELIHVLSLQKTIKDIESVTTINNIFGYKTLLVNTFSLYDYFGTKEHVLKTQVTLRYVECKNYNLEYCGNIYADIHAVNHYFVDKKIGNGSANFNISNNLQHIKELNLSHIQKISILFYTENEDGSTDSNYCELLNIPNIEILESVYSFLKNNPYSIFINLNNSHHLIQNSYCEFFIRGVENKVFGFLLTINEYGEFILIDEDGNGIVPELIGDNYKLHSCIDSNHFKVRGEKEKFMEKLHDLISLMQ